MKKTETKRANVSIYT